MYENYRKPIIPDLEKCLLKRGYLYYVCISEGPLSEVSLPIPRYGFQYLQLLLVYLGDIWLVS